MVLSAHFPVGVRGQEVLPQPGAQLLAADFANSRGLELRDEDDLVRNLEIRKVAAAHPRVDGSRLGGFALRDDEGAASFAEKWIGDGNDSRVENLRVGQQVILDLLGGNLFAS